MTTYRVLIEHRKSTLSVIIVTIQMEGFWHEYFHWAISYVNADDFNWCCNFVDNVPVFKGKGIVFVPLFVREKANIAELLAILGLFSIEFGYFSFPWWFGIFSAPLRTLSRVSDKSQLLLATPAVSEYFCDWAPYFDVSMSFIKKK